MFYIHFEICVDFFRSHYIYTVVWIWDLSHTGTTLVNLAYPVLAISGIFINIKICHIILITLSKNIQNSTMFQIHNQQ